MFRSFEKGDNKSTFSDFVALNSVENDIDVNFTTSVIFKTIYGDKVNDKKAALLECFKQMPTKTGKGSHRMNSILYYLGLYELTDFFQTTYMFKNSNSLSNWEFAVNDNGEIDITSAEFTNESYFYGSLVAHQSLEAGNESGLLTQTSMNVLNEACLAGARPTQQAQIKLQNQIRKLDAKIKDDGLDAKINALRTKAQVDAKIDRLQKFGIAGAVVLVCVVIGLALYSYVELKRVSGNQHQDDDDDDYEEDSSSEE